MVLCCFACCRQPAADTSRDSVLRGCGGGRGRGERQTHTGTIGCHIFAALLSLQISSCRLVIIYRAYLRRKGVKSCVTISQRVHPRRCTNRQLHIEYQLDCGKFLFQIALCVLFVKDCFLDTHTHTNTGLNTYTHTHTTQEN